MSLAGLIGKLKDIEVDPSILIDQEGLEVNFMKQWLFLQASEEQKREYSYVWNLVHGWDIEKILPSTLITASSYVQNQLKIPKDPIERISQLCVNYFEQQSEGALQYLSKNQMVIKFENNLVWINPSQPFPEFPKEIQHHIVVITSSNMSQVLDFLEFSSLKPIKLITTEIIYRKMKHLSAFLRSFHSYNLPIAYLLKPDEYFQYGHIRWLMRQNCWLQPSFDLKVSLHHIGQAFLIQSPKLQQTKLIYYGWKKGLITQANYQKYIKEWDRDIIKATSKPQLIPCLPERKKEKIDWYLTFISKELICTLDAHEQDHLFGCCEIIELIPNQIIAKKGYRFDFLYVQLQGKLELRDPQQPADNRKFYGLEELTRREETYGFTLASVTRAVIMRIDKANVLFHLYDRLY